jgi:hypothetical protein
VSPVTIAPCGMGTLRGLAQPTGRWMIALLCDHEAAQMMRALARSRAYRLQAIGMM